MIQTGFEKRVKVQQIIESQLPEFILTESPKAVDFLKQYYVSQEFQGSSIDLSDNLDQYLKIDNLSPEVISGTTTLSADITSTDETITVSSTKGFPSEYGLLQINSEIITYTGISGNSFTGCIRGFSGVTSYESELNPEELVFESTVASSHTSGDSVKNLSSLFLKEFYNKLKYTFTPGLENVEFVSDLDVNNFVKEARGFYQAKGTEESYKILFKVLYGISPRIIDLEDYLTKPSSANYRRREVIIAEAISGDPNRLVGQTIVKSTDSETKASISEVEIFTRSGIQSYYKIGLFVGFNDKDLIDGIFNIQPKTKVVRPVSVGDTVITVDSTIGFSNSGIIVSGGNTITYKSKTVNQFLDCSNVTSAIPTAADLRSDEVFIGYEDGDLSKKVELSITGVLSKFESTGDITTTVEGERIYTKNVGEKILNPETNKTKKQLFANSWIYNTSSRFEIETTTGQSNIRLKSTIDDSSLKVGDYVDILSGQTETVLHSNALVSTIDKDTKQVTLDNLDPFQFDENVIYTIRRNVNTASSDGAPIAYGNDTIISDVQNVYNDLDGYAYVASNSLPSYTLSENILSASVSSTSGSVLQGYNPNTEKFSIISFENEVPFITGDEIYYTFSSTSINGLEEGYYYVRVLSESNKIKLYASRSLIVGDNPVEFTSSGAGTHTFTLSSQRSGQIYPQKLLRKFPLIPNITNSKKVPTIPGSTGLLSDGVEIINYKSTDKIYYGPLEKIVVYNGGTDYDIIFPPEIEITGSASLDALSTPEITGNVKEIKVDPQDFDIVNVLSASLSGGNGSGCVLEPVLENRYREIEFDPRMSYSSGGVDPTADTITFLKPHYLRNGDALVYVYDGDYPIGIGTYKGSNLDQNTRLGANSVYYAEIVSDKSIKIYNSFNNYSAGINTVGFTTAFTDGIHKFRLFNGKNTLKSIKVINPGENYQYKNLKVKPEYISTTENSINFINHGFSDGEVVVYHADGALSPIGGLIDSTEYRILKVNDNSFRLASNYDNYVKKLSVNLTDRGAGYHSFAYPSIQISVDVEYDGVVGVITATPIVRGTISNVYLHENGLGYGSTILNFHKKPNIRIKTGKGAELKPTIINGKITRVEVGNGGSEYTTAPDLAVLGDGVGAKLRAIVSGGKVVKVVVINSGIGYNRDTTSISITPVGRNAILDSSVRNLTLNNHNRFGNQALLDLENDLQYGLIGYTKNIGNLYYNEIPGDHSKIIGWAYDGNPIYGAYGYADPEDIDSQIKILQSGYTKSSTNIIDRPSGFDVGFFVEDYKFDSSGDLDEHNGRYERTPEFPDGVYAYHASITADGNNSKFPYFIGNTYRSNPTTQSINQDFDFNNSSLLRNTFPYKVREKYSNNDFIVEPYETLVQSAVIDSVSKGSVDEIAVNYPGFGYRVNDPLVFDNAETNGGGLSAYVESVTGKTILSVGTTFISYQDALLTWEDYDEVSVQISPSHEFIDGDQIAISGLSTFVSNLSKVHKIGVSTEATKLASQVESNSVVGLVTDIFVINIPQSVSTGTTVSVGSERMSVLGTYPENKVIRVLRGLVGSSHTVGSDVIVSPDKFTLPVKTDYFVSKKNDKIFFNSVQSIGVGATPGISIDNQYFIGDKYNQVSVPTQSIYIPNHPFQNSQEVTFERVPGSQAFTVSDEPSSTQYSIPRSGNSDTLFVINKSKDYIGLCTQVELTTSTNGLYFRNVNSNNDSRDYRYSLTSNFDQVTAKAEKIVARVSVSTDHGLLDGDIINLSVKPNQSVGIGTSTSVYVKYNSLFDKLLINPVGFNSSSVNQNENSLTLVDHGLKTADKVFYDATDQIISGLNTGTYYVYRIDDDNINLTNTRYDATSNPPSVVSFGSTGGSYQQLSKVNPKIHVIRNNNLVFDVSHPSLSGYNFKIFYDNNFNNELVSIGSTTEFTTIGLGTVGVTTTATFTLKYNDNLPSKLYYQLEKGGFISTADREVDNYSEILFTNSEYTGTYNVSNVKDLTYDISLGAIPENLNYNQASTSTLNYSSTSTNVSGGVSKVKISSGGSNYKKIPTFVEIVSTSGQDADVSLSSSSIGRINLTTIEDPGFDFSSDKTLSPQAYISPLISLSNNEKIDDIEIISSGSGYTTPPDLVVVNPEDGSVYEDAVIECEIQGSSISRVNIIEGPKGLSSVRSKIYATNNSNGVSVTKAYSSSSGIVTCVLSTPISGFRPSTVPFSVGDMIYVEGMKKDSTDDSGTGFNSEDYNYTLFTVSAYRNTNPAEVEYDLSDYTLNAGVVETNQNSFANIINQSSYPTFNVLQSPKYFTVGEKILTKSNDSVVLRDLIVSDNLDDSIKVYGSYILRKNDVIIGKDSGTVATVSNIVENNSGIFKVDYSLVTNYGWSNDTGKLSEDYQVLPDNDYYQNLSYSIKSPITYDQWVDPVNRLVHTTGLKNFADTEILSSKKVSAGNTASSVSFALIDFISDNRVDTINSFDRAIDFDVISNRSKFLKLRNKKLSDYILCKTNRVLSIDNISPLFNNTSSNQSFRLNYSTIDRFVTTRGYNRFLVQFVGVGTNSDERQVSEVVVVNSKDNDPIIVEKSSIFTGKNKLGDIEAIKYSNTETSVNFYPTDIYGSDYDIKAIKNEFNSTLAGINTETLGFVNLIGSNSIVGSGLSSTLYSINSNDIESLFVNIELTDNTTKDKTLVDLFLDHDGSNTSKSEFFFTNDVSSQFSNSGNYIGTVTSYIDNGILSLNYENTGLNDVLVRARIVGFGLTSAGTGTHIFKNEDQSDNSAKFGRIESIYSISSGITTVASYDISDVTSIKTTARVSYGSFGTINALHQVLTTHNEIDSVSMSYPFLAINNVSGIGTFGSTLDNNQINLIFYPDGDITGDVTIQLYNEILQTESDIVNVPQSLTYGTVTEDVITTQFNGIYGSRNDRLEFDLKHNETPIFEKQFNPESSVDLATGIFTIDNHFFSTGERLSYTPRSTFPGESFSSLVMSNSLVLPSEVYAIKLNNRQFKLATSESNANSGISITFNSFGSGNGHTLEMYKKMEKSLITVDGLTQSPLSFTPIVHNLYDNGGSVSVGRTYFSLSGISSVFPGDILKIGTEYVKVESVGIGTTSEGPITSVGSFNLVKVNRGFVGSSATSHTDGSAIRVYTGSFNIVRNKIYFTEPPYGNILALVDDNGLPTPRSSFGGRVYLRQDYSTNVIYDDISARFTGIGATYTLTLEGSNTTETENGSGLVFINGIFQGPITQNNPGGIYNYITDNSAGISSVVFTGIVDSSNEIILSDYDVNQNQLPRGGMIVSLGSTSGLGYAPLVGAAVTAVISAGVIQNTIGIGSTDVLGSGYYGNVSIGITDPNHTGSAAVIQATVGAGGTLSFNVINGGSGYTSTAVIQVPEPSYENLEVIGVSRLGIGQTTDTGSGLLMNIEVGPFNSSVGIGSTLFTVKNFKITRPGWGFKIGDKFKPVGLVTDKNLQSPIDDFELEVLDIFNDKFSSWQFGELDYIDPIATLQDGVRTRFPLEYNGDLVSFEIDSNDVDSAEIDINSILLVYINGVLQEPGDAYRFEGGTSIVFADPPKPYDIETLESGDKIDIFFYTGTRDVDSVLVTDISPTIKSGDIVNVKKLNSVLEQDQRTVYNINTSDKIETNIYSGVGVDDEVYRDMSWTKQKIDKIINGEITYKSRDSIKSQIYPTSKVIGDFSATDTEIFVDNVSLFNYENGIASNTIDALIVDSSSNPVSAAITATVSPEGTISLSINDGGSGYSNTPSIKISAPKRIGVGIGTTATAIVSSVNSNGNITGLTVTNAGFGYTPDAPPQVIVELPNIVHESIENITSISGFDGTVTGIDTAVGTNGNALALKFTLNASSFSDLQVGYPIYIFNTSIGSGVTSIDGSDSSIVGVGTTFLDNVYVVNSISSFGITGIVTCNIHSSTSTIGLSTSGDVTDPRGFFSWGRISGFTRSSSPIAIGVTGLTVDQELSSFPTIQRRGYGLRNTGSLR